ncbi:MAG: hypothetical protein JNM26_00605 [Ideonella sp.]|nr:hypothetical protein [Ideonella sp.]
MPRLLAPALLLLASCGGGGGGGAAPPPVQPDPDKLNPAPTSAVTTVIDMTGTWRVTDRDVVEANTTETNGLDIDSLVTVGFGQAVDVDVPGIGSVALGRSEVEALTGFPLDWYQNSADGSRFDYGYGWDRLRVAGGGGAMRDFVQYGIRIVALSPNLMFGYEAEVTQDFLGQPRFNYVATLLLARQSP